LIAAGDDDASRDSTTVLSPLENLQRLAETTFVMSSGKSKEIMKNRPKEKRAKIEPITNTMTY